MTKSANMEEWVGEEVLTVGHCHLPPATQHWYSSSQEEHPSTVVCLRQRGSSRPRCPRYEKLEGLQQHLEEGKSKRGGGG